MAKKANVRKLSLDRLKGQNKKLYYHLKSGKKIHCFSPYMLILGIGYLNSRISDLRNKWKIKIRGVRITVVDRDGELASCKLYSIQKKKNNGKACKRRVNVLQSGR